MDQPATPTAGDSRQVTDLLLEMRGGDPQAMDRLFPLVYEELRRLAHAQLRRERPGHTLGTTGLVHETIHLNGQFAGTSETTGVQYVGNQVFNTEFNSRIGEEHTVVYMFTLIGQGSVPNEKSTFQFHITVLPDLTVTSYIDDFHIRCQ